MIIALVVLDVVVVNAGLAYLGVDFFKRAGESRETPGEWSGEKVVVDECGSKCQRYIDMKLAEVAMIPVTTPSAPAGPSATPKVVYVPTNGGASSAKTRSVSYVAIPGSGSTGSSSWTDIGGTEFYFNGADYPGLVEVYFEANMKLFNGNGTAYVQLFDVTHGIGVQGSDVQTNSQTDTLVTSGKVYFWAGKNLIRVQARSLTADTAVFTSGRLRVVTEN